MKKILIAVLLVFTTVSLGFTAELKQEQQWTESADGALSLPQSTQDAQSFNLGWGCDLSLGYRFNTTFSMSCVTGYYEYPLQDPPAQTTGHFSYIPLMVVPRLNLNIKGPIHPYFFCGFGMAFNSFSTTINSVTLDNKETDLFLAPGVGVIYPVMENIAFFLQGRVDIDFTSSNGLGKGMDSPSIFIPIQGGVGFFVL